MDVTSVDVQRWGILFAGPLLFLLTEEAAFLLAPWSCETGSEAVLHATHGVAWIVSLGLAFLAWREWRRSEEDAGARESASEEVAEPRFLAILGLFSAATFSLLIGALWLPTLALEPCAWL